MKKANLNILINAELKEALRELARKQNRTLSNLVETELKTVVKLMKNES